MLHYEPMEATISSAASAATTSENWSAAVKQSAVSPQRVSQLARMSVLMLSDVAAVFVAAGVGYLAWAHWMLHQPPTLYLELAPLAGLLPLMYLAAGLTPGFGLGAVETLRRLFHSTSICFLAFAGSAFVFKANPAYSRMSFAITWLVTLVAVPLLRFVVLSLVSGLRWWGEPTLIVGEARQAELTIRSVRRAFSLGYRVMGVLLAGQGNYPASVDDVPVLGGLDLAPHLSRAGVTTVLAWDSPEVGSILELLSREFRRVVIIRDEKVLPVEHVAIRNLGGVLGIEFTNELLRPRNQAIKRISDVVLGSILMLLALPLLLISAVLIKLVSRGPMFFSQERESPGGVKFRVWKLRTMCLDAEDRLKRLLQEDPALRREWLKNMKLKHDPRIIPVVGSFLRRSSIDELPQLWSVITGWMSLVGPRPLPSYHLNIFPEEFRKLRAAVRPGLTGMWQVMVRNSGKLEDQIRYDTYYIRNWSLWLDLYILARTMFAVISARGAR